MFFLKFPCFLCNPANVGNLISSSSSFSKPILDIWTCLVCIMLKPSMQDCKHVFTIMGDEWNCPMVSTFFGTILLGNWDKNWPFPVLLATAGSSRFADLLNATPWWCHPLGFWIVLLEFQRITSHTKSKLFYDTFGFLILRFLSVKVHNNSCCIPRASLGTCLISVCFYSKWSFF